MKPYRLTLLAALVAAALPLQAADGGATAEQAAAMVKKGVAFIKANGADKGYAEITSKTSQFKLEDLIAAPRDTNRPDAVSVPAFCAGSSSR